MLFKNKIWRIYTGDYSDIGYQLGENWARQNKPRNSWGLAYIFQKNIVNQFWQAEQSDQTLKNSFYQGFDDTMLARSIAKNQKSTTLVHSPAMPPKVSPQLFTIKTLQGVTMSNLEHYDLILAGLNTAKYNVNTNIRQLSDALSFYSRQIEAMQGSGFLEDYADKLKAYNGLKMRIEGLQNFLHQIHEKISDIEVEVQKLRASANTN